MNYAVKIISILITVSMLFQVAAFAEYEYTFDAKNDGYVYSESDQNEYLLLDVEDKTEVKMLGLVSDTEIRDEGRESTAMWDNHVEHGIINMQDWPSNILEYSHIYLKFYVPENYNNKILMYFQVTGGYGYYIYEVTEKGWHEVKIRPSELWLRNPGDDLTKVNRCYLLAHGGWGVEGNPDAVFYIQDFKLIDDGTGGGSASSAIEESWVRIHEPRAFSEEVVAEKNEILKEAVAIHKNIATVLNKGQRGLLAKDNPDARMESIGGVDMVPARFFEEHFGAEVKTEGEECSIKRGSDLARFKLMTKTAELSGGNKTLSNAPCMFYGEFYLPLSDALEILGLSYTTLNKTYIIGEKAVLDSIEMQYELSECVAQSFTADSYEISDEDYAEAIENVKKIYIGGDNDMTDADTVNWISKIEANGEKWFKTMIKDSAAPDLWLGITASNPGYRAYTYAMHINDMALAWGAKGSKYYQNEDFLNSLLFAIDWFCTKVFTPDNKQLVDYAGGWWNWQYGTPNSLLPALFIVKDVIPDKYMAKYCEGIDWLNPSSAGGTQADRGKRSESVVVNMAGNKMWQMRIVVWSAILQKQPERIKQEIDRELRRSFEYIEHVGNGQFHNSIPTGYNALDNFNCGFYADGSYIDHQYYPYIAGYGANYFGVLATMLRSLNGTVMFPTDPAVNNQIDWIKNALAPFIWKNHVYWRTCGRSIKVNSGVKSTAMSHYIDYYMDMLHYVSEGDAKYLKSLIKTQGQYSENENSVMNSLDGEERKLYREILADDSIPLIEEENFSHVYFNQATVTHSRKDWRYYVTMSSTEVGLAEIYKYSGENWDSFHQADGHTTLMTRGGDEYDGHYWNNVDPTKASGVTSVERPFDFITGSVCYSGSDFVGGTTLDNLYTVAVFDFYGHNRANVTREDNKTDAYYSDLSAHKSWFMFDDEIVCLGSGITTTDGYDVITTVENKRLEGRSQKPLSTMAEQYNVVSVNACGDDGNIPQNTIDHNFSTRWSYEGVDGWIQYDLGEVKNIGYLGIALYAGDERKTKIRIKTSGDGVNWETHFDGESDGETSDLVAYPINRDIRYVRIECGGNNKTGWNSISEVHFYAKREDGKMPMNQRPPYIYGTDDIWVDGTLLPKTEFQKQEISGVNYVNIENVGGYYFPEKTDLVFDKYADNETGFIDFYTNHGKDPVNAKYAYAVLPKMTKDETVAYSQNPKFTILKNEADIQCVRHNELNITGTVFWKEGETDLLKTDTNCVVNMYMDDKTVRMAIAEPSKKTDKMTLTVKIPGLTLEKAGNCVSVSRDENGYQKLDLDFTVSNDPAFKGKSYKGNTYTVEFTKEAVESLGEEVR